MLVEESSMPPVFAALVPVPLMFGVTVTLTVMNPPAEPVGVSLKIWRVVSPAPERAHPRVLLISVQTMSFGQQPPPAADAQAKLPVLHFSVVAVTLVTVLVGRFGLGVALHMLFGIQAASLPQQNPPNF